MKQKLAFYIKGVLQRGMAWQVLNEVFKGIEKVAFYKAEVLKDMQKRAIARVTATVFRELTVLSGPFEGLKYPGFHSHGSALFPKLAGSYECELHAIFQEVIKTGKITQVIDIGCAEGYYAVGLALRLPRATVYGYDLNKEALALCHEMALANGVQDRVVLKGAFVPSTFSEFDFHVPTFIITDCEGFELELYTEESVRLLSNVTLLIELHDFVDRAITATLTKLFAPSHHIQLIQGTSRNPRLFPEIRSLNRFEQEFVLDERRPEKMNWLFVQPRHG